MSVRNAARWLLVPTLLSAGILSIGTTDDAVAAGSGLVAQYAFDKVSGTTDSDLSGNGNTATLHGATFTPAGKYGGAVSLTGGSAMVTVPASASLDLSSAMTIEAWVRAQSFAASQTIVAKERRGGGFPYGMELNNGVAAGYASTNGFTKASGSASVQTASWKFIAATYDGSTLRTYVGGAMVASVSAVGSIARSSGQLSIGGDSVWGEYFKGRIDNVRIYNRALSSTELAADRKRPVGVTSSPPPLPTTPPPVTPPPVTPVTPPPVTPPPAPLPPVGDLTSPSTPDTLGTSNLAQTSLTLGWAVATDNVGVTGYDVFVGSAKSGTTATTSFTVSGLSCGTTYTLGVAAHDAAGNTSGKISTSATTAACPTSGGGPTANVWIDKNGGSCLRSATPSVYADATSCGSFQSALNAAQAGDTVLVTCNSGTSCAYSPETLSNAKGSNTSRIAIQPAPGTTISFQASGGSGTPVWLDELHNVNITDVGFGTNNVGNGSSFDGNLRVDCSTNVTLTNATGRRFHMFEGNSNFLFAGGSWGGYSSAGEEDSSIGTTGAYGPGETCNGASAPTPTSVTFDGVSFHDVFWGSTEAAWGGSHPDCFEVNGYTANLTIENSQFYHCGNTFLSIYGNQGFNHNLVIQNNTFRDLDLHTWFGIAIHGGGQSATDQRCGNLAFRNNTYTPNNPNASGPYSPIYVECAADNGYAVTDVTANTFDMNEYHGSTDGTCEVSRGAPYATNWHANTWLRGTPCGT